MVSAQQEFIPTAALMALPLTSSGLSGLNLVMYGHSSCLVNRCLLYPGLRRKRRVTDIAYVGKRQPMTEHSFTLKRSELCD